MHFLGIRLGLEHGLESELTPISGYVYSLILLNLR
jgi:hypothetical protein